MGFEENIHFITTCGQILALVGIIVGVRLFDSSYSVTNCVDLAFNYITSFNKFNFAYILLFSGLFSCFVILWFYSEHIFLDVLVWFGLYKYVMYLYHGGQNPIEA